MYCDVILVVVEFYIGLVEVGVGFIFGGGGIKEFVLCVFDCFFEGDV